MPHTPNPFAPVESTSKPRRRDPKNTRERLVRAALDLFTTQGYHASTTPQVAHRAGVAEGTIYRHFTSKEQLLNEIYRGAVRMFTQVVEQTPARTSCRDRMNDVADRWGEVAVQDPPLVKLVFVSPPTGLLDEKSREAYEQMRVELEKVVASGKASNEIRPGPAYLWTDVWLQLVRLMLERVAAQEWAAQHSAPKQVIEAAWDAIAAPAPALQPSAQATAAGIRLGR
jgi:AcrR family transcriptional regulator